MSKLYRKEYKKQHRKKQKYINDIKDIDLKFKNWNDNAKKQVKLCKENKISIEDLKKWFKSHENWM